MVDQNLLRSSEFHAVTQIRGSAAEDWSSILAVEREKVPGPLLVDRESWSTEMALCTGPPFINPIGAELRNTVH